MLQSYMFYKEKKMPLKSDEKTLLKYVEMTISHIAIVGIKDFLCHHIGEAIELCMI